MLYYNTISGELRTIVETTCTADYFSNFRLCGGSALALQKGHRVSLDADFVTDNAIDRSELTRQLYRHFNSITDLHTGDHGVFCKVNAIKVDFLTWNTGCC